MNRRALDLNLLRTLDALLTERSVTLAGRRVGLSQPATSNALARLRALFDDQLLVRARGGMQLTARAKSLARPLAEALEALELAIAEPRVFDPSTAQATIALGVTDYAALVVIPPLTRALRSRAPGIELRVHAIARPGFAMIETGEIDLAIVPIPTPPPRLRARPVFRDRMCSILRDRHPLVARARLSIEDFVRADHVLITVGTGTSPVDDALRRRGLTRRIVLRVPHFSVVPLVVRASDMIATVPERLAQCFVKLGLTIVRPPLRLPEFEMKLVWHEARDGEPAQRWFRELLVELFSGR